jgi:glycosyltransferase involved in cell wall biosynthesis
MIPRVLILGLYYPPANFMAGRRLEGWARHLPFFGYEPLVLTRYYDPDERNNQDFYASSRPTQTLKVDWVEADGVIYTNFTPSVWSKLPLPGKVRGLAHFLWPDPDHSCWLRQCSDYLKTTGVRPDLIIASYSPAGVLRVARELSESLGVPWVADFRDLWVQNNGDGNLLTRFKLSLQRQHLRSASGITVVTDGMGKSIREQLRPLVKDVRVIYNGAEPVNDVSPDPKDSEALKVFSEVQTQYPIVLTYTGTLYPEQHVERFLNVVREFNEKGGGPCAVLLCGRHDPGQYVEWAFVKTLGVVSHATSLFLQSKSAALFYPTWPASQSIFSGKIFELALSGQPVLVGFTPSPDLEALCRKFQTVSLMKDEGDLIKALGQLPCTEAELAVETPIIATKKYWAGELARFFDEILHRANKR